MKRSKFTIKLDKLYGDKLKDRKKTTLASFFKIPIKLIEEIEDRGLAAARNTGMRPGVTSANQWANARVSKFILNVVDAREGKEINKGPGQDSDVILKAIDKNNTNNKMPLKIRKSNREGKKFMAKDGKRTIHFGQEGARDYTLINNKNSKHYLPSKEERDKVRDAYQSRHAKDKLNNPFSPGALSYYILWTAPTMRGGIKNYEKKFGIDVQI